MKVLRVRKKKTVMEEAGSLRGNSELEYISPTVVYD